ncbi:MAG: 1-deoxy-D-xylulose-5-phosphate synthase N-terminal domain-containing protein [Limisphaerales bacterium]
MIDGRPSTSKKLTLSQLQELSEEIRQELIAGLAKGGGHLGPESRRG